MFNCIEIILRLLLVKMLAGRYFINQNTKAPGNHILLQNILYYLFIKCSVFVKTNFSCACFSFFEREQCSMLTSYELTLLFFCCVENINLTEFVLCMKYASIIEPNITIFKIQSSHCIT